MQLEQSRQTTVAQADLLSGETERRNLQEQKRSLRARAVLCLSHEENRYLSSSISNQTNGFPQGNCKIRHRRYHWSKRREADETSQRVKALLPASAWTRGPSEWREIIYPTRAPAALKCQLSR
uniref:Uncharacterized protein n=1 Tax=Trichuris muris TaxID=70415 RepID=A0A5S6QXD3_TRIMR